MFGALFAIAIGLFGIGVGVSQNKKAGGDTFGPFQFFGPFQPKDKLLIAAQPILSLIRQHESRHNYNIIYGGQTRPLTSWNVARVLEFQQSLRTQGAASSAVGAYQFIYVTLNRLVSKMGISRSATFSQSLQDKLALELLKERGLEAYVSGRMSRAQFMLNIAKEWASFPRDGSGLSYYHGDGLNKALVSPRVVENTLNRARSAYA